uniref:Putative cell wall surface anchor family protein n=1 Tax=Phlebotomus kandelakii TaxID=1109342 RepID=A0A6B2E5Y0_9DIPT
MTLNPLIVIFYALCSHLLGEVASLPVTSKPLASNPDHLAWEAWLTVDSRNPFHNDMTRKITPKSIFIAPNFRNESLPCPTGFKIDHRGQCIRVVSIDPNDLLANRLQSILASTNIQTDDDEIYDYDAYDTSGPFQVNLPLSLDANSKLEQSEESKKSDEFKEGAQALKGEASNIQETVEDQQEAVTTSDEKSEFTTEMSLMSSEDVTEDILGTTIEDFATMTNQEVTSEIPTNTTSSSLDGITTSTSENTFEEENSTQPITESDQTTEKSVTEEVREVSLVQEEENEKNIDGNSTLKADLERNNLVLDVSSMTQSTDSEEPTTMSSDEEVTEMFTETIATSPSPQTFTETNTPSTESHKRPIEEKRVVIITDKFKPSRKEFVLIVTPIPNVLISTTDNMEESTQFEGDKELLGISDETEAEKKMREMVIHQEQKDAAMEKIDAHNRFVYHHLKNPTTTPLPMATDRSPTTTPLQTTISSTNAEVKEIAATERPPERKPLNKFGDRTARPQNRIRFPTDDDVEDSPEEFKADLIRFPGPASHRLLPNMNRLIPESLTRKPTTAITQNDSSMPAIGGPANRKQSWYPPTWRNTTKQQKPVLLRFWSRMPLIRDSSFTGRRSLGHRENSKSPSDNLYKDIPPQDMYRAIGARQKKHTNS